MSRIPLSGAYGGAFNAPAGTFRYGYAAGTAATQNGPLRVLSVHLTPGSEGDGRDTRGDQVAQLLRAAGTDGDVVIAGDLNTHPDEPPLQRILAAGYVDAGAAAGIGHLSTWPALLPNERIDYVFLRGNMQAVHGQVAQTTASDHLPVLVTLRNSTRPRL